MSIFVSTICTKRDLQLKGINNNEENNWLYRAWFGCKLFAKVTSRRQNKSFAFGESFGHTLKQYLKKSFPNGRQKSKPDRHGSCSHYRKIYSPVTLVICSTPSMRFRV